MASIDWKFLEEEAKKRGIDPKIARGIVMQESGGKTDVKPRYEPHLGTSSWGPMQILETTARGMGFRGTTDELASPEVNIPLGLDYLASRRAAGIARGLSGSDLERWTVAAYNSGIPRRVTGAAQFQNQGYVDNVYKLAGLDQPVGGMGGGSAMGPEVIEQLMGRMNALGAYNPENLFQQPIQTAQDDERLAREQMNEALTQLGTTDEQLAQSLQQTPLSGPRMPVPEEQNPAMGFGAALAGNLASVFSGNPMFSEAALNQQEANRRRRDTAIEQNLLLERQDLQQRRGEILQNNIAKYEAAAEYYRDQDKHTKELEFKALAAKAQGELDNLNEQRGALKEWGKEYIQGKMSIDRTLAGLGLRYGIDGQVEPIPGVKPKGFTDLGDKLPKTEDVEKLITDLATTFGTMKNSLKDKARQSMQSQWVRLHVMPRQGDNASTVMERISSFALTPAGVPGRPEDEQAQRDALINAFILAYADIVPGAREAGVQLGLFAPEAKGEGGEGEGEGGGGANPPPAPKAVGNALSPEVQRAEERLRQLQELDESGVELPPRALEKAMEAVRKAKQKKAPAAPAPTVGFGGAPAQSTQGR